MACEEFKVYIENGIKPFFGYYKRLGHNDKNRVSQIDEFNSDLDEI